MSDRAPRLRRHLLALLALATGIGVLAVPSPPARAAGELSCDLVPGGDGGAIDHTLYPRATSVTAVMLYLDFSDAPATSADAFDDYADRLLPDVGWLEGSSYGRFDFEVRQHRAWLRMPEPAASYGLDRAGAGRFDEYIADAIATADPVVDFTGAELLYLVPQRSAPADFSPATTDQLPTDDGAVLRGVVTFGSDMFGWERNLLAHETGHLFGLPDLYAYDTSADPDGHRYVGGWDVMGLISGQSNELLAWQRRMLGWLDATDVACVTTRGETVVALQPLSALTGTRAVVLPTGAPDGTVHVLEFRDANPRDQRQCSVGVLAYRVRQAGRLNGAGVVQVLDATPGSNPTDPGCDFDLDDGVLTAASGTIDLGDGFTARVEDLGTTATVTVSRTSGDAPTPVAHDPAAQCDQQQDNQGRFSDVPAGHAHGYNINCIVGYGITDGYADGTFQPAGTLTRAQTATFLARMLDLAGALPAASGTDHFDDDDGTFHEEAINRLADAAILATSSRSFAPTAPTSRATMARWTVGALARGGRTTDDTTDWYDDDDQDPAHDQINALTSLGVVTGKGGGRYDPSGTLSRAQMATFLARAYSVLVG